MRQIEFRLTEQGLSRDGGRPRAMTAADRAAFEDWIGQYRTLTQKPAGQERQSAPERDAPLLKLGATIAAWLDGPEHWLTSLRDAPAGAVIASFRVNAQPSANDRRFLEVPWEIAAQEGMFLAVDPAIMWAPLRRLGDPVPPPAPDHTHKLGVMFVAAAPDGQNMLDFEAEEEAILRATSGTPMDLYVEDEGSLDTLRIAWNDARTLDVLHVSCHGMGGAEPFLALEDEYGDLKKASLADLAGALTVRVPRLLFLSACHTGESQSGIDSLALGLTRAGFPTVLGWADAVRDSDASRFAAALYREAAQTGATIQTAWAAARFALMRERERPAHWHLARLFLGPSGGGALSTGNTLRISTDPDAGRKAILEARGQRIEVASRYEFIGRRRQLRAIRQQFRVPDHAGVLIHGAGRQGKSSLAARVIDRHPHLRRVALFRACDGRTVLGAIREEIKEADPAYKEYLAELGAPDAEDDPLALRRVLRDLLTGPCGEGGKPILLVLDDFEALLDKPEGEGHWRMKPGLEPSLAAIIRAFDDIRTPSRLLITCRYDFPFLFEGRDLGGRLLKIHLPPMSQADVLKQAARKRRATEARGARTAAAVFDRHVSAAIQAARGNTGIRDMLFQALLADAEAGARAIRSLEDHFTSGAAIEDEALRETVEGLIVDELLKPLTAGELALLRASTLFDLPVPLEVWRRHEARIGPRDRLLAFGVWDRFPDLADSRQDAAAINAIAAAKVARPEAASAAGIIAAILPDLFAAWGGPDRSRTPVATDIELTRLALTCGNATVLSATAAHALRGLGNAGAYRLAARMATETLDCLDAAGHAPVPDLFRAAGEIFDFAGDAEGLRRVFAQASTLTQDDPSAPGPARVARAQFRVRHANWLNRQGEPDQAREELNAAASVFEALGDRRSRAVTLGDIARIMTDKGDVNEALALHREMVETFQTLGDRRSRAVTLGDIARIMTSKGDVNEALALHRERIQVYETLGDRRARANALFDLGRMKLQRVLSDQDAALFQEALAALAESHAIFNRSAAWTGFARSARCWPRRWRSRGR